MFKKLFFRLLVVIGIFYFEKGFSQEPFVIGMFSFDAMEDNNRVPLTQNFLNNNPTSHLPVLAEDGFNVVTRYWPHYWSNIRRMKGLLALLEINNMKLMTNTKDWYKANQDLSTPGTNVYNSKTGSHPNYDLYFDSLYSDSLYKNLIWAHQVTEESALHNDHNFTDLSPQNANGWPPPNFVETEVPLENVTNALNHFKNKLAANRITNQKITIMEAMHGGAITEFLVRDRENNNPQIPYSPKYLLDRASEDLVFLEGSYMRFPKDWAKRKYQDIFGEGPKNNHHLGFLKTIDFAQTKVKEVQDVVCAKFEVPEYWNHFHSNSEIENANYLWFQTYASIIHGVTGIWFWALPNAWQQNEEKPVKTDSARFKREHFPEMYKDYIGYLSKEIRYLANNGFLEPDGKSEIYTKKDYSDSLGIIPNPKKYIEIKQPLTKSEHWSENYGLRYTLRTRTNGKEVIMIVVNPLDIPLKVDLNFTNLKNKVVAKATHATVLFDNNREDVQSKKYKTDRNSHINLRNNHLGKQYHIPVENKKLKLEMGPMDAKILLFALKSE